LYNLQEKFDRGIITQEEWSKIVDKFGGYLWKKINKLLTNLLRFAIMFIDKEVWDE
jgi:hypothetical protein